MARNRKNENTFRLGPALMAVTLCGLFALLGVGYVWYKNQISVLGLQIKERESRLTELQRENRTRRDQMAVLCSPVALDASARRLNLGLGPPAITQIISIEETTQKTAPVEGAGWDRRQAMAAAGGTGSN